jgi:polysaccharide pyruvyl transferase CsaB
MQAGSLEATTSRRGAKVVILGWYGHGNMGDEAILECMLASIRSACDSPSFVVLSKNPSETEKLHKVRSIKRGRRLSHRIRRFWSIANADLFILGGGGLLSNYGSSELSVLSWLGPLDLANRLGVATMTYGIGVAGEWTDAGADVMKRVLGRVDAVCVRDEGSLDNLLKLGVTGGILTADPAVLLPEVRSFRPAPSRVKSSPRVSVFLRHWYVSSDSVPDEAAWQRLKEELARCLDSLVSERSASVRFVPMRVTNATDDDREVAREVLNLMVNKGSVEVVEIAPSFPELLATVDDSDLLIGMRLHSLIVAATLGVPAIGINYHPKVLGFMDSVSSGDWVYRIGESPRDWLQNMAEQALDGRYPRDEVHKEVAKLKLLASQNTQMAVHLLNRDSRGKFRKVLSAIRVVFSRSTLSSQVEGSSSETG